MATRRARTARPPTARPRAGRVTFDVVCPNQPEGVRTRGELTLGDERFEARLKTTSDSLDETDFTVAIALSRAGDCAR